MKIQNLISVTIRPQLVDQLMIIYVCLIYKAFFSKSELHFELVRSQGHDSTTAVEPIK